VSPEGAWSKIPRSGASSYLLWEINIFKWQVKRKKISGMNSKNIKASAKTSRRKPETIVRKSPRKEALPKGPFKQEGKRARCCLLIFVPRSTLSAVINDLSGRYGYSHLAVDCGDVDIPTGKRVMIESTIGEGVHSSFQDEYGDRNFVRIPLENVGIDTDEFCDCVRSKLGEKFDREEALTFGILHNPAEQICSDLASGCLPLKARIDIARYYRAGILHPDSAVNLQKKPKKDFYLFISPNSFAEYFGAPRGKYLAVPDQLSEPVLPTKRITRLRAFFKIISMSLGRLGHKKR
jgi:hypothetical protein